MSSNNLSCATLLFRHVVPASHGVWPLCAFYPSVGRYGPSLSSNQRGPKVRLATSDLGHDYQQVSRGHFHKLDP